MKTVIEMAEACGIPEFCNNESQAENIMAFAALVAAAEREACAALVDRNAMGCDNPIYRSLLQANAAAIRAMGEA